MTIITHALAFILGGTVGITAMSLLVAGRDDGYTTYEGEE